MVLKIEVVKKYQEQCAPKMIWFNEKQKLERFGSFFTMQLSIKLGYKSKKRVSYYILQVLHKEFAGIMEIYYGKANKFHKILEKI